jgi:polar amino acid transport system substrate-binding protein
MHIAALLLAAMTAAAAAGESWIAAADQRLRFATPLDEGRFTVYLKAVFDELGRRIGIPCTLVELPKKRCLSDADQGLHDGVAARISGLRSRGYTNLVRVDASHYTVQHIVFARPDGGAGDIPDLDALLDAARQRHLQIGYLQGSKQAEHLLAPLPAKNRIALNLPEQAFRMLAAGRLSAYLAGPGIVNRAVLKRLKAAAPEDSGMQEVAEVFIASESALYPYLHAKHAALVPPVEAALRGMKTDGTLDALFQAAWWPTLP